MRIGNKPIPPWSSPTLDRLVTLNASLKNPIDPEEVKRILFPRKVLVQTMLRIREEALTRNKAYRNKNKQMVAWIRQFLHRFGPMLQEETTRALRRELAPYGDPEDAESLIVNGRRYKNVIEFEKALLGVDTDKRNHLLTEIVNNLEDYLRPRLECAPGLPRPAAVRRYIRELILDAYPFHTARIQLSDGTERPVPAGGWDRVGKKYAVRDRVRKER